MPKRIEPISANTVKHAKPRDSDYKISDGFGLHLLVTSTGGKLWRMQYRFGGKQRMLTFGTYPAVTLADARDRREDARKLLANGNDPGEVKKAQKAATHTDGENSLEVVARLWHAANVDSWSPSHAKTTIQRLEKNVFPWLGTRPVADITLSDIRSVLQRVEQRAAESARRLTTILNMIFRYCITTGKIKSNPLLGLQTRDILVTTPIEQHMPAIINPKELGHLLRAIDAFKGSFIVRCAFRIAPLVFQRPGDLRHMEWADLDFDAAEWNIPIPKMKLIKKEKTKRAQETHCVPLSSQVVSILREIQPLTQHSKYVFHGHRSPLRPMSESALTAALQRMGYKDEQTWHGFRATARTILDEVLKFRPDIIDHQLAHMVRDAQGRAYNRTSFLPDRHEMMQKWADYLDELKNM